MTTGVVLSPCRGSNMPRVSLGASTLGPPEDSLSIKIDGREGLAPRARERGSKGERDP